MIIDEEEADGIEEWMDCVDEWISQTDDRRRRTTDDGRRTTTTTTTTDDGRPITDDDDDIEYIQWPQTIRPTVATRGDDTVRPALPGDVHVARSGAAVKLNADDVPASSTNSLQLLSTVDQNDPSIVYIGPNT